MRIRPTILVILCSSLLIFTIGAKTLDPYKVLGVERNASQREIQKAFHKLSLQYHPDKNKKKGAQEKFSEINNAYDILSDEEKRKNYDLFGDEKGNPGFDAGNSGGQGGYTYFTSGGPGQDGFSFRPGESNMGGHGGSRSFSFSFGGSGDQNPFGFGLNDIFSNFFRGGMGGGQFGSFSSSKRSDSGSRGAPKSIYDVNSQVYKKEIINKGMTWLILSYTSTLKDAQHYESIIRDVANSLQGALKVGRINCETELSFCKELGVYSRIAPRVFVYSFGTSYTGSLVEYNGDLTVKDLKTFCQEHLPRFSKRIDSSHLEVSSGTQETLPKVMLLSTKRDTPVIWRVLSGLYKYRFAFCDVEVHDVSNPMLRRWGVDALPAIVGWLSNGERHILKSGITVKDIKSSVEEIGALFDGFEKKNKKAASSQAKKASDESGDKQIPLLTGSNFDALCGESTPVCIVGVFRSSRGREKLEIVLSSVSQKSFSRRRNLVSGTMDSISYALLDASKHSSFLGAFDKSGFKSLDKLLIAYKPRRTKFAAFVGDVTVEEVERFISSVLNGDVQFSNTRKKPTLK